MWWRSEDERERTWSQVNFLGPFIFIDRVILFVTSEAKWCHFFCQYRDPCLLDPVLSLDVPHPRGPVWTLGCVHPTKAGPLGWDVDHPGVRVHHSKTIIPCCHLHWLPHYLPELFVLQSQDSGFCLIHLGSGPVEVLTPHCLCDGLNSASTR